MEYFDILNPDGTKTGQIKQRELVHRDGDLHAAVHIFIMRKTPAGYDVLLQKRSRHKDSFPGRLDTSSAGHLSAGDDFVTGAVRECKEELGLDISPLELQFLFDLRIDGETTFYNKPFKNHELVRVYRLLRDVNIQDLTLQQEEIESVCWMDMTLARQKLQARDGDLCIYPREYEQLYHMFYPDAH